MTEVVVSSGIPTKDRILDAAEKLFCGGGFEQTSLRDITTEAQVNLAAVNYHFQSKESLIEAVIARRIEPINRKRIELLDAAGENPTVEQILTAFLSPLLETEIASKLTLLGRVYYNRVDFVERVYQRHLKAIADRFRAAFAKALPQLPAEDVWWRLHFSIGSVTHVLSWGQILPVVTEGVCTVTDREALLDRAVRFLAAGFRAGRGAIV